MWADLDDVIRSVALNYDLWCLVMSYLVMSINLM